MEGKKILVTGASGFVGHALALELCKHNQVYGLARFGNAKVKRELEQAGVATIQRDVHREGLDNLPRDFDYVFSELAMLTNCDQNPEEAYAVNTYFVGRLMDCCRKASGVVLASTGAVYVPGHHPWDEHGVIGPRNTYSTSKFGGEVLGNFLCQQWRIPTCILRYFYPYGPAGGRMTQWARQIVRGEEIAVNRNCVSLYSPIYISDCVRYTIEAARLCSIPAKVINIGGTEVLSQTEIVASLSRTLGMEPKLRETDEAPPFWVGDVSLMIRLFGPPAVAIADGLARVAEAARGEV